MHTEKMTDSSHSILPTAAEESYCSMVERWGTHDAMEENNKC